MQCPKCGAIVLKGDVTCKKCGASLMEASENFHAEDVCRSRAMLFLRAWVGAPNGAHLKWLGYDEEAAEVAAKYGILEQVKSSVTGIFCDGNDSVCDFSSGAFLLSMLHLYWNPVRHVPDGCAGTPGPLDYEEKALKSGSEV